MKLTNLLLAFAIALVTGCASITQEKHTDVFSEPVKIVWVKTQAELEKYCSKSLYGQVAACSDLGSNTIYAFKPRSFDDKRRLESLGHELLHIVVHDTNHTYMAEKWSN